MIDEINKKLTSVNAFDSQSKQDIEAFRIKYLGKKGILNDFFAAFKNLPSEEKRDYGRALNTLKNSVVKKVKTLEAHIMDRTFKGNQGDLSRPGFPLDLGARHPISLVKKRIVDISTIIQNYGMAKHSKI